MSRILRWLTAAALMVAVPAQAESIRIINGHSFYPEGLHWAGGLLYYTEMTKDRVMVWDGTTNRQFWRSPGCGPTAVVRNANGTFYIFCHMGNRAHEVSAIGRTTRTIEADVSGESIGNPNEAVLDGSGGVYFTSSGPFAPGAPPLGRLFYIAPDGSFHKVADGIRYANGLTMTPDRRSVLAGAHLDRKILRYPVIAPGKLGQAEPFLDIDAALGPSPHKPAWYVGPDVLLFDGRGNLYICEYGAGRVLVFSPDHRLIKVIGVPQSPFVNSISFGNTTDVLYIGAADTITGGDLPGKVYEVARPLE
ncbi:MAG: SMP-30/gluconolactonase/LRE family protein [Reyranellaceae bacterium]